MSFTDLVLNCNNCRKDFTFTVREHEARASQGFPNEPLLCPSCRLLRNNRRNQNENGVHTSVRSDKYFR